MEFAKGKMDLYKLCKSRSNASQGFVPLPKSVTPLRIESNADIYDFELNEEDMASLETGEYSPCTWDPTVSPLDN